MLQLHAGGRRGVRYMTQRGLLPCCSYMLEGGGVLVI